MKEALIPWILSISIALQLASAVTALLLTFKSGFYRPWLLLSAAIALMALRRIISFAAMIGTANFSASAFGPELIALFISILMFSGLLCFSPAFTIIKQKREQELKARDLLIRETHHHVKNDLQMLESLVGLQEISSRKTTEKQFLLDLKLRIGSFSLLHEFIYSSGLSETSFREYLENLASAVVNGYGDGRVRLEINIEDAPVNRRDLLYCGLIVNEALTNSFKYAFDSHENPVISLKSHTEAGKIVLAILDNGIGLPEDAVSDKSDSYGFSLIRSIGSRPEWDIIISSDAGTRIEVSFPVEVSVSD